MKLNKENNPRSGAKGFTLIELLIVIAILAVLSVVVILTLNPAELLKQARDSTRVSDMATYKSAIALYLADVTTPFIGTSTNCYAHSSSTLSNCQFQGRFATGATTVVVTSSVAVNGYSATTFGWMPINFSGISSGAPISVEPIDPTNNATYFYAYRPNGTVYKITVNMESGKYQQGGSNDVESTDGGISSSTYEVGTDLAL
jgi:prepilin-type N-terminal cleavage/methylation domain-containing protein